MIKTSPTNPKGYAVEPFAAADGDFELEALTEQEAAQEFYSRHGLDDSEVMDESDIVRKAVRETARRYREHMMGVFTLLHLSLIHISLRRVVHKQFYKRGLRHHDHKYYSN